MSDQDIIDKVEARYYHSKNEYTYTHEGYLERVLIRYARWIERAEQKHNLLVWLTQEADRHKDTRLGDAFLDVRQHLGMHKSLT